MTTVATLDTNLTLNSTAFRQGMIAAANQANASLKGIQAQAQQTATVMGTLNKAAAAFGGFELLKSGLGALLDAQVQLQAIQYTLLSATGNSIQAGEAMQFLRDESDKLGLSLPDTAEGFARLSAAATASGVSMADQQQLFDAFAKASSTLHLSVAQSGRALLALQEMFSRGVISARQLNQQLGQAIPGSAARFKNAVMEMVKGTDLEGKSFDQLQKSGKLVTTEFLPALTAALQGAGAGWEEASQGLNANLNRLSTAWFNLKTELSGGLFSDAASSGAALLAQNLNKVAVALQLVAGVAVARGLSSVLGRGVGAAQFQLQNFQGTQQAALAEREYAEAQIASAQATVADAEAEKARSLVIAESIAELKAQAVQMRVNAAQAVFHATSTRNDAAAAFVPATTGTSFLPAQDAVGAEKLAAAELNLAKAQRVEATAAAAAASFRTQAAVASTELLAADLRLTAAEDALTVAQARVAATRAAETALGGLGAAIGRAAASFSSFALSLVGGPWGVAILAIGGLALAFESAKSSAEHLETQTKENTKAVEELVKQAVDLRNEFAQAGNTDPISKLKDSSDALSAALLKNTQDLAKARQAADDQEKGIAHLTPVIDNITNAIPGLNREWFKLTGTLQANKDSADQLTAAQQTLSAQVGAAESAYVAAYGGNWDKVNATIRDIATGAVPNLAAALQTLGAQMREAFNLDKVVDNARKKLDEETQALEKQVQAREKILRQKDMNPVQRAQDDFRQMQADAVAAHTNGLSAETIALNKRNIAVEQGIKADDDAKKAATEAAAAAKARARAAEDLLTSQQGELAAAKAQLSQDDKMVPARKQLNEEIAGGVKAYNGMTSAQQAASRATLAQAAALEEQYIAQEKARKSLEAYVAMKENLDRVLENSRNEIADNLAAMQGQSDQATADAKALEDLRRNYTERQRLIDKNKELTEADAQAATADNKAELDKQLADYLDFEQKRADALGNAMGGMRKAIADFVVEQNNQFAAAQKFTTDFLSQTNDALTAWETGSEGAKKAFGDLMSSMEREAAQFVNGQIFKSLLLAFNAPGTEGQPGAGQSFWSNLKQGLTGGFSAGTGLTAAQAQEAAAMQAQTFAVTANTTALASLTAALSAQSALGASGGSGGLGGFFSMLTGSGSSSPWGSLPDVFSPSVGGSDVLGSLGDLLPGLAGGGAARARKMYRVTEKGPEQLNIGDQSFLLMGNKNGSVIPNQDLVAAGTGGDKYEVHVHFHGDTAQVSRETMQQQAGHVYRAVKKAQRDR